jgi:nucleotide-binding universal stress UspA family protein
MHTSVRTILVALDGSSFAERAIEPGKRLAANLKISVGLGQYVGVEDKGDNENDSYLQETASDRGLSWCQQAEGDTVADGLVALAKERDATICMSTHGHGRAEAIMGSHAERALALSAEGVVLVGRGYEFDSPSRIRNVLVPLDGTPYSETVCAHAIEWADQLGVPLRFVTMVEQVEPPLRADHPAPHRFGPVGDPHRYIAGVVERYQRPGITITGEVHFDPLSAASGFAQLLRDGLDSLLIVAVDFRTGMQRLIHGSIAGDLIDVSPVMVLAFATHAQEELERP